MTCKKIIYNKKVNSIGKVMPIMKKLAKKYKVKYKDIPNEFDFRLNGDSRLIVNKC